MRSASVSARVVSCTRRPPSITNKRSATSIANDSTCSDTTIVISRNLRITGYEGKRKTLLAGMLLPLGFDIREAASGRRAWNA